MNESSINAILGPGSNHTGTLVLKGRVLIEGHLAGSVFSDELIEVAQGALVEGGVSAPQVLVGGVIKGRIEATERVTLLSTALVEGELVSPWLDVRNGAQLGAQLKVDR